MSPAADSAMGHAGDTVHQAEMSANAATSPEPVSVVSNEKMPASEAVAELFDGLDATSWSSTSA